MNFNYLKSIWAFIIFLSLLSLYGCQADKKVAVDKGDTKWWVGVVSSGHKMPLTSNIELETRGATHWNQVQPLILSNEGDVIFSEHPMKITYKNKTFDFESDKDSIFQKKVGGTLKDAYLYASKLFFPPSDNMPNELLFTAPQFNTWIELTYNQNQTDILNYARSIIDNGFEPGVLMIDDTWQKSYGQWEFDPVKFPDPEFMISSLHKMGFKVMLWIAPFVSGDIPQYRDLKEKKAFLKHPASNKPLMVEWWNGQSAVLDLSNPVDQKWFKSQLERLVNKYNVDGFKFDAGDAEFYVGGDSYANVTANQQTELYAQIGLDYSLNEFRATWKMGGKALAQRLSDKDHSWEDLEKLIPQMNLLGIMGYPFSCPDLIGGGQYLSFEGEAKIDQELIVRSAQAHALMPMMQFSVAPWRILDPEHLKIVKEATDIRKKFKEYILETAKNSARTGEPIMRHMEYEYPHMGYAMVKDQFLIGENLLVAPIIKKNSKMRTVFIPPGKWRDNQGHILIGPVVHEVTVELDTLPYYSKI